MSDHSNSPFLNSDVSQKALATPVAELAAGAKRSKGFGPVQEQLLRSHLRPYKGGTQKTKSSLPLQAKLASARLDRKKGTTATPFGVAKALTPKAIGSLAAHSGSIPRNSSKFKLSTKLASGKARKAEQIRLEAQINGRPSPRSTKGTRLDGHTTD